MFRLEKVENVLRGWILPSPPNEILDSTTITIKALDVVRLIDQLGSYRDGLQDAKEMHNAKS